jgi:hypothetical protein
VRWVKQPMGFCPRKSKHDLHRLTNGTRVCEPRDLALFSTVKPPKDQHRASPSSAVAFVQVLYAGRLYRVRRNNRTTSEPYLHNLRGEHYEINDATKSNPISIVIPISTPECTSRSSQAAAQHYNDATKNNTTQPIPPHSTPEGIA